MPLQTLTPELAAQIAADYPKLQSLNLSCNALRDVRHLQLLPQSLVQLDLSGNCLLALPEELGTWLPALRLLRLHGNALESLRALGGCKQLQTLDVGANNVALVSELRFLQPLTQLRHLTLSENLLAESVIYRRETLAMLPQLQTLDGLEITVAERLHAKLQLKTQLQNDVLSPRDQSPAPSRKLLLPDSLRIQQNWKEPVTMLPVKSLTIATVNGLKKTNEVNQNETQCNANEKKSVARAEEGGQPSPLPLPFPLPTATTVTTSLTQAPPFGPSVPKKGEMVRPQATKLNLQGYNYPRHGIKEPRIFEDKFDANTRSQRTNNQYDSSATENAETRESLLKSRVEALEGILAIQDRTMRQTLLQFGEQSSHFQTNYFSKSNSDVAPTVKAAAAVYTRLLAAWREKCVGLMVQAQSNQLANEAIMDRFQQQEGLLSRDLARCEENIEMWQRRAADFEAQRDLEVVATRQAEAQRVKANEKCERAVRTLAVEREKLQSLSENVVQFTGGLVREKVELLHGSCARLQALERRLVLAKERIDLAFFLVTHREARLRNSEAALEADRRVWAHRLEQMRNTRLQGQENSDENNHDKSDVTMRLLSDGKLLRPATETALRALFHGLDCYDTGMIQSHVLLHALRHGDTAVLNVVGGPKKLSKLVSHVEAALAERNRGTLTWGEFLLLFIPESSTPSAMMSENCLDLAQKVSTRSLSDSTDVCYLCTKMKNNEHPSWPFDSMSSTSHLLDQTDKETIKVRNRRELKAMETLSLTELVHQVAVLKKDRQYLWHLLARDAHDLRGRVRRVRQEWEAKTSKLVLQVENLQRDLKEQIKIVQNNHEQQEQAKVAQDEASLEIQRLRELLSTQKHDFELQRNKQEAELADRLQHEHDVWQTEIQDARLAHSLLQIEHGKQQVRIRQLERDITRQKESLIAHETERVASLEDKVRRRDSELARLRREQNTILNSLRAHEQKLAMVNAEMEAMPTESVATQTDRTSFVTQKSMGSQTHAVQAGGKRDKTHDQNMPVLRIGSDNNL
ncbi:hypothetical leucine rich repeat protein [Plasmopara halstedii]|uniref:Hypothetical leucine rich repeat protein n=1 Tax=Plasmopara halstedii TaxID=4781 RepID=A0A0P1AZM6_PLAHL|nr:hypothetical leucine rich repeat protein [Plasmopara halstedii]CEG47897.1 hypothetical leucine rich repeat protein [Plasmopara halstedii]|eukprot:XP_024584266.1 hypothetical leucine rich repeat protein [Plasmopara halstedii]